MKATDGLDELYELSEGTFACRLLAGNDHPTLTVAEQIAAKVGDRILDGDLTQGSRIIEQDIATEFQVSRGPVREALWILERENLVVLLPRRGAVVTQLTVEDVTELFEIRTGLHDVLARKMMASQIPEYTKAMRAGVLRLQELARLEDDNGRYAEMTYRMALIGARLSGNSRLFKMIAGISLETLRYSKLGLASRSRRLASIKLWKKKLDALERGDLDAYVEVTRQAIEGSCREAVRMMENAPATPRV